MSEKNHPRSCFISAPFRINVDPVIDLLRNLGVKVLRADDTVLPGGQISDQIRMAIKGVDFLLAVLSEGSRYSNVYLEIGIAVGIGRPVFVISAPSTDLPSGISGVSVVKASIEDTDAIKFHLDAFLSNAFKRSRARISRRKDSRELDLGVSSKTIFPESVQTYQLESEFESYVCELFQSAGLKFVAQPTSKDERRAFRPDIALWLDDLPPSISNPLIVEVIGRRVRPEEAIKQVRQYIASIGTTAGVFVHADNRFRNQRVSDHLFPVVIGFHVSEFADLIANGNLAREIVQLRNRIAHGGR